jgi:hypothetical protein
MKSVVAIVGLLALAIGASAESRPQETQEQRDKRVRDYETIGRADTMAVMYGASCLSGDNNQRDQCHKQDIAILRAAIKAVENQRRYPKVAEDAMLIVKLESNRGDTAGIPGSEYHKGAHVSLTVYDARDKSVVYKSSRAILQLSNDARQLLTEFLDFWAFLHLD